jgi:hypothetical protein
MFCLVPVLFISPLVFFLSFCYFWFLWYMKCIFRIFIWNFSISLMWLCLFRNIIFHFTLLCSLPLECCASISIGFKKASCFPIYFFDDLFFVHLHDVRSPWIYIVTKECFVLNFSFCSTMIGEIAGYNLIIFNLFCHLTHGLFKRIFHVLKKMYILLLLDGMLWNTC